MPEVLIHTLTHTQHSQVTGSLKGCSDNQCRRSSYILSRTPSTVKLPGSLKVAVIINAGKSSYILSRTPSTVKLPGSLKGCSDNQCREVLIHTLTHTQHSQVTGRTHSELTDRVYSGAFTERTGPGALGKVEARHGARYVPSTVVGTRECRENINNIHTVP
ncbi:hypothetical protein J6590_034538 [Homalodisca vitripennis]|nr:hypothetical protein J6590_034538 [Homalodisca vitripennis]